MSKKVLFNLITLLLVLGALAGIVYFRTSKTQGCDALLNKYKENHLCIATSEGNMVFELYTDAAPKSVAKIKKLANDDKFYDNLEFYRVVKGFVVQGGLQNMRSSSAGISSPTKAIQDKAKLMDEKIETESDFSKLGLTKEETEALASEKFTSTAGLNTRKFQYGSLSFANAGAGTNSTEIFVVTDTKQDSENIKFLNGRFTNMGMIVEGKDVLEKLNNTTVTSAQGVPASKISIFEARVK